MNRLLMIAIAAGSLLAAAEPERFDLKVRTYFFSGFSGDKESLEQGMKMCEEELAVRPKSPEALVWHGAGLYFQSGQLFQKGDPQHGMELWQRGMKEMDLAVELAPDRVGVRIPRGAALFAGSRFLPNPEMAKPLIEKAISDYEKSYEVQAAVVDSLPIHPRGELLIGMADGYARLGNKEKADDLYARIEKDLPGSAYSKKAAKYKESGTPQGGCLGCHTAK